MEATVFNNTREEQPVMCHTVEEIRRGLDSGRPFLSWVVKLKHILEILQQQSPEPLKASIRNNTLEIQRPPTDHAHPAFVSVDFSHNTYLLVTCTAAEDAPVRHY